MFSAFLGGVGPRYISESQGSEASSHQSSRLHELLKDQLENKWAAASEPSSKALKFKQACWLFLLPFGRRNIAAHSRYAKNRKGGTSCEWKWNSGSSESTLRWDHCHEKKPAFHSQSVKSEQDLCTNRLFCPQTLGWSCECYCALAFCSATAVCWFPIGAPSRAARRTVIQQHCWLCWLGGCIHNICVVSKCGF